MPVNINRYVCLILRLTRNAVAAIRNRRHGYFFILRRVVVGQVKRAISASRGSDFDWVDVEEAVQTSRPFGFSWVHIMSPERPQARVRELHPQEHIKVPTPGHLDRWLRGERGWGDDHVVRAQKVFEVPDCVVFGTAGWVGPSSTALFADLGQPHPFQPARIRRAMTAALDRGLVPLKGTTVSLLQFSAGNYFHWMLQGLPRLALILEVTKIAEIDHFLVPARPAAFVLETLDRVGVPRDCLLDVDDPGPAYCAERLVAATMLAYTAPQPSWAVEFVRSLFPSPRGEDASFLYIERGATRRRPIVNEEHLVEQLGTLGFARVSMDGRTIAEQALLFARASCIVAPHGAALTNLVFARPGTPIVEIVPANWPNAAYALLAHQMNLRYRAVVGSEAHPPRRLRTWIADAEVVVDARRVVAEVTGLLAESAADRN